MSESVEEQQKVSLTVGDRVEASRGIPFGEFGYIKKGTLGNVSVVREHGGYEILFDGDHESVVITSGVLLTYVCSGIKAGQQVQIKHLIAVVVPQGAGYAQIQELKPGTLALVENDPDEAGLVTVLFSDDDEMRTPVTLKADYLEVVLPAQAPAIVA